MTAILLLSVSPVQAGAVEAAEVTHKAGRYSLDLTMRIDSDPQAVHDLVTDYERLERISDTIIESSLLDTSESEGPRRRLVMRLCILFFCFTSTMVEDVVEKTDGTVGTIVTTIVPAQSDYRYGQSEWSITAAEPGTRIYYRTTLEPDFWIPPLIGTWLMKKKMRSEAKRTILNLERLASND